MRPKAPWWWFAGLSLGLAMVLAGCSSTATVTVTSTGTAGATATATNAGASGGGSAPTAAPAVAPQHAFAWFQVDSHNVPQIWASINGGNPQQITHVAPDGAACDDQVAWSPPVFSPDLTHIVASLGSFNCGDGALTGPVSVITVSNGSIHTLSSSLQVAGVDARSMGWLDNSHIWFITYANVYTYTLGASAPTQALGSNPGLRDAVRRGSTLFLQVETPTTPNDWTIEQFNLSSHMIEGIAIDQGNTGACKCSPGDAHGPGWDVAPDGFHITYQKVTPNTSSQGGIASSKIYTSGTDGANKKQIALAMITTATCLLQYSWDGQWIAFTEAPPSPATLTASVNTSGGSGDPNFHGYSPDTSQYPVWKWDNSQFWAATVSVDAMGGSLPSNAGIENFHRNGSSSLGVAKGFNPWYTVGG